MAALPRHATVLALLLVVLAASAWPRPAGALEPGAGLAFRLEYRISLSDNISFVYIEPHDATRAEPVKKKLIAFSSADVSIEYSRGIFRLNATIHDALRLDFVGMRKVNETRLGDLSFGKEYAAVETPMGPVLYEGEYFVGMPIYYVAGPLRLDRPAQRIIVYPAANVPLFASICSLQGNITDLALRAGFNDLLEGLRLVHVGKGLVELDLGVHRVKIIGERLYSVLGICSYGPALPIVVDPSDTVDEVAPLPGVHMRARQGIAFNGTLVVGLTPSLTAVFINGSRLLLFTRYWDLHPSFRYLDDDYKKYFNVSSDELVAFQGPSLVHLFHELVYHETGVLTAARVEAPVTALSAMLFLTVPGANTSWIPPFEGRGSIDRVTAEVTLVRADVRLGDRPVVTIEGGGAAAAAALAGAAAAVAAGAVLRRAPR